MTILDTNQFIAERMKINPITRAELERAKPQKAENPFGFTKKDLVGKIKDFPMGVVIKMVEEALKQDPEITERDCLATLQMLPGGAFDWRETNDKNMFWSDVITFQRFNKFFEKYPEYRKYNL